MPSDDVQACVEVPEMTDVHSINLTLSVMHDAVLSGDEFVTVKQKTASLDCCVSTRLATARKSSIHSHIIPLVVTVIAVCKESLSFGAQEAKLD